ncbi:MAG: hypothetical protein ACI898_002242 [Flavobacteriales bacterium]|jgi:uncharacterized protein (TIGR02453 family)
MNAPFFTTDFNEFFIELAGNNHKEWFHANRKRYETSIKKPFEDFIAAAFEEMKKEGEQIDIKPGDAIFRINKDIRFSKDKSPYKLNRSAIVSPFGRKDKSYPGLYINFGPEKIWIGGGAYSLEKEQLYDLRDFMSKNPDEFRAAIEGKSFKKHFKQGLQGEKNKIIPKEFKKAVQSLAEIANKQFYYMSEHSPDLITSPDLLNITLEHWRSAKKVRVALIKGMFRT